MRVMDEQGDDLPPRPVVVPRRTRRQRLADLRQVEPGASRSRLRQVEQQQRRAARRSA